MKILVTGTAGFIGSRLAERLLERGEQVIGIDNLNDYYDVNLKKDRLEQLESFSDFQFYKIDLHDKDALTAPFKKQPFDVVVNLAAQAGVRYSLENPRAYIDANVVGTFNVMEAARERRESKNPWKAML